MLGIGAVNGGRVGPEATTWIAGMLPIASLYWVLFTGYALAGRALIGGTPEAVPATFDAPVPSAT